MNATAKEKLLALCPPGKTIYAKVNHVARSGMSRNMSLYIACVKDGQSYIQDITYLVASACGYRYNYEKDSIVVGGYGMDMCFEVVYNLSNALHSDGYALNYQHL